MTGFRPGGLDLDALLRQARESAARLAGIQAERDALRVVGTSPDELLTATVDGQGRVVDLTIDPRAMRLDSYGLAERLLAAINDGYARYEEQAQRLVGEAMGDPDLYQKVQSGEFDAYEYLKGYGLNMPEIRGQVS
jgi:DNA-binding protein YbaB